MASGIEAVIAGYLLGGGLIWTALHRQKRTRQVEDTPRSKIASAPQGHVELQGFAWPESKSLTTVDGFEAVYYSLSLQREETRGSGKNRRKVWVTVWNREMNDPFYLVDATGLALILPAKAEINIEAQRIRGWKSLSEDQQRRILDVAAEAKVSGFPPSRSVFGFLFNSKFRICEREIRVGCPLYANGDFRSVGDFAQKIRTEGLTQFAAMVLDEKKRTEKNVDSLLDKNKDGKVSALERREGYTFAAKLALEKARAPGSEQRDFDLYGIVDSNSNHKLLIADAHEKDLVGRLKNGFWFQLIIGAAVCSFSIFTTLAWILANVGDSTFPHEAPSAVATRDTDRSAAISELNRKAQSAHEECVEGRPASCAFLLENGPTLELDDKNLDYYSRVACSKGLAQYCPPRDPASR